MVIVLGGNHSQYFIQDQWGESNQCTLWPLLKTYGFYKIDSFTEGENERIYGLS